MVHFVPVGDTGVLPGLRSEPLGINVVSGALNAGAFSYEGVEYEAIRYEGPVVVFGGGVTRLDTETRENIFGLGLTGYKSERTN